jgi:hypothetical protein
VVSQQKSLRIPALIHPLHPLLNVSFFLFFFLHFLQRFYFFAFVYNHLLQSIELYENMLFIIINISVVNWRNRCDLFFITEFECTFSPTFRFTVMPQSRLLYKSIHMKEMAIKPLRYITNPFKESVNLILIYHAARSSCDNLNVEGIKMFFLQI